MYVHTHVCQPLIESSEFFLFISQNHVSQSSKKINILVLSK